jgi:hypothetical protein
MGFDWILLMPILSAKMMSECVTVDARGPFGNISDKKKKGGNFWEAVRISLMPVLTTVRFFFFFFGAVKFF